MIDSGTKPSEAIEKANSITKEFKKLIKVPEKELKSNKLIPKFLSLCIVLRKVRRSRWDRLIKGL